jgi:branched-chain amino acid transport system substrate-binding protein
MTGQYAAFGQSMRAGAGEAVAFLNRSQGLRGQHIQLLVEDDGCDRAQAVALAERLVAKRIALVVGHHCASASIAAAPLYAAAGIVMISPGTTDPMLTDKRAGPSIFRLAWRDDAEGPSVSGAYLAHQFAGKRVAILHDRTQVGIKLAAATKKAMNAAGLAEVLYSGFIAGERDYSRLARDLRTQQIDAVYLGAYPREAHLIYAGLRANGQTTTVLGSHLLAHAPIGEKISSQIDGMLVTAVRNASDISTNSRAAIEVWWQAVRGEQAAVPAIQKGKFETSLGEVTFDKNGDAKVPYFKIHMWKGGELVPAP